MSFAFPNAMTKYSFGLLRLVVGFALWQASAAHAQNLTGMMSGLFDGPPHKAAQNLHPDAYVEVKGQRLANPKIAYINWRALGDLLRKMGYQNPPTELTSELAREILDRAGFAVPTKDEPASAFLNEFRTLYAIRYGGLWINYNFGSGRNAAEGALDNKGFGRTILVRPWADAGHSNGVMSLAEAVREAFWGNILHEMLPHGANRVLFIVTTGTLVNPTDKNSGARAMAFREDSERPAYWQRNWSVDSDNLTPEQRAFHTEGDRKRIEALLPTLLRALPIPRNMPANATPAQILRAGLFEFIDRVCLQYTTVYTRQTALTGISTSNVEISGKAIDYGAASGLIGFPKIQFVGGELPPDNPEGLKRDLIIEFANDLRTVLPPHLLEGMPSNDELSAYTDARFKARMIQNFLELAGTPKEFSEALAQTDVGTRLGSTMFAIAQAGNVEPVSRPNGDIVGRTGTYNLEKIMGLLMNHLADKNFVVAALGDGALMSALVDPTLRMRLVREFSDYLAQLKAVAKNSRIDEWKLLTYIRKAVQIRNKSMDGVRETGQWLREIEAAAKRFSHGGMAHAVQDFIDRTSENNVHEFKSAPFTLETSTGLAAGASSVQRSVFDLRGGVTRQKTLNVSGLRQGSTIDCEAVAAGRTVRH